MLYSAHLPLIFCLTVSHLVSLVWLTVATVARHEYLGSCAALMQFVLADAAVTPNFDVLGVVLISGALVADAFVGNTQESLFTQGASLTESVTWPSAVSAAISFGTIVFVDGLGPAIEYVVRCKERAHLNVCFRWRPVLVGPRSARLHTRGDGFVLFSRATIASPVAFLAMVFIGVFNYLGLNLILTVRCAAPG